MQTDMDRLVAAVPDVAAATVRSVVTGAIIELACGLVLIIVTLCAIRIGWQAYKRDEFNPLAFVMGVIAFLCGVISIGCILDAIWVFSEPVGATVLKLTGA